MTSTPHRRLSLPNLIAFSTPGFSIGALAVALTVYLPHYYAAHFGLALGEVAAAVGGIRFLDLFLDPLIGVAMDRTKTASSSAWPCIRIRSPRMAPPVTATLMVSVISLVAPAAQEVQVAALGR